MARQVCRTMSLHRAAVACLVVFCIVAIFKNSSSSKMANNEEHQVTTQENSITTKAVNQRPKPRRRISSRSWASEFETVEEDSQNVNLTEMQSVMNDRKATRDQVCSILLGEEKKSYALNPREFVISDKYKLIWCNIFKSASSTWFFNFLTLAGISHNSMKKSMSSPVQFAREKAYPRPSEAYLSSVLKNDSYTSFIIVREPFERLLSGYRDKIESTHQMYYNKLRCFMSQSPSLWRRVCSASFPEFVEYITTQAQKGEVLDEHWHPYTSFCAPCLVDYTYILHFESLRAEEYFMFQEVPGLSDKLGLYQLWSSHTVDYEVLLRFYFSQLSRQQMDKLVEVYRDDFLLGGYSWDKYYGYISKQTENYPTIGAFEINHL